MSFPSSALEVVRLSGGQLKVIAPPSYIVALPFFLIFAVSATFFFYRVYKSHSLFPLWGMLWCLPWLVITLSTLRSGSVELDRGAGTARIQKPSFFWHKEETLALRSIRYARVMTTRNGSWVALVLQNGDSAGFADSTDGAGKGQAAEAINEYLGTPYR